MKNLYKSLLVILLISSYSALKADYEGSTEFVVGNITSQQLKIEMDDDPIVVIIGKERYIKPKGSARSVGAVATIKAENMIGTKTTIFSMNIYITKSTISRETLGKPLKLEFTVTKTGNITYKIAKAKNYTPIKDEKNSKKGVWHTERGAIVITSFMKSEKSGFLKTRPVLLRVNLSDNLDDQTIKELANVA